MTTCPSCGKVMDPILPANGYSTHPLCKNYDGPSVSWDAFCQALVRAFPRESAGEAGSSDQAA